MLGDLSRHVGDCCWLLKNYARALIHYFKAMKSYQANGPISSEKYVLMTQFTGHAFAKLGEFEMARRFLLQADENLRGQENSDSIISVKLKTFLELGNVSTKLRNYDEARKFYLKASIIKTVLKD